MSWASGLRWWRCSEETVKVKVRTHGSVWTMMFLQVAGFAFGGLAVFGYLRSLPHCQSCMLLLSRKGKKTRYFSRSREMRSAVDEVFLQARGKEPAVGSEAETADV